MTKTDIKHRLQCLGNTAYQEMKEMTDLLIKWEIFRKDIILQKKNPAANVFTISTKTSMNELAMKDQPHSQGWESFTFLEDKSCYHLSMPQ